METDKETPQESTKKALASLAGYLSQETKSEEASIYTQEEKEKVVKKLKSLGYL